MMSDETKKQVILMSVGIVLHNLVLFLICLIWFRSAPVFLGILTGMAAAELWHGLFNGAVRGLSR